MKNTNNKLKCGVFSAVMVIMVMTFAAVAVLGPADPIGMINTGLSKKPGGTLALGMGSEEIVRALGASNTTPSSAGFAATTVSTVPLANEMVWEYTLKVNTPYTYDENQGSWTASETAMGEVRVFRHIGFDKRGKAVIDIVRVANPIGRGVEMTSAVFGNFGAEAWRDLAGSVDDANGMRESSYTNLQYASENHKQLGEPGARIEQFIPKPSAMSRPNLVVSQGKVNGQPVLLLGEGWDVNPVGTLGPNHPAGLSPLLWTAPPPTPTGGKGGGGISVQVGTVPGVDIRVKKCPCGIIDTGSVGVVTNVTWMAVGSFDEKKLRALATEGLGRRG